MVERKQAHPGRSIGRGLAEFGTTLWLGVDAGAGAVEIQRLDGNRDMFPDGTWLHRHYGNFSETQLATFATHLGEEAAIQFLGVPPKIARTLGFLFVMGLDLWVETPLLGYPGTHNAEFGGDMTSAVAGYVLIKLPLLMLSYLNRTRPERGNST